MSKLRLLIQNLLYFRWANLAVLAGMAVATAVLTGALMVGDSVRGSLRALAVQRLGPVDYALVATRFFEQSLGDRIAKSGEQFQVVPAVIVRGGASGESGGPGESGQRRTAGVQIAALGGDAGWVPGVSRGGAVVNGALAEELGLGGAGGGTVLLSLPTQQDIPREATLARRSRQQALSGMRVTAETVVAEPGMASMFSLEGSQRTTRNAWVNLAQLQSAIEQPGRVNALLVHDKVPGRGAGAAEAGELNRRLREVATLADYGLSITPGGNDEAVLNARGTYLPGPIIQAAEQAAAAAGAPLRRVSVYLVNTVAVAGGDRKIHYAVVAGIDPIDGGPLAADEVALNQWTADRLGAKVGDRLTFTYFRRQPRGELEEVTSDVAYRVARVLPMQGLGADRSLTPEYKGLTDAKSVSDWDPPEGVEIDKKRVTPEDEAYWKQYQAAPKLFVSFETARKLWGGAYGDVTSLRVPAGKAEGFKNELRNRIDPASLGLSFQPVKAQQLAAATGSTDFAMLFVGFSFFLIAAAALLVAMLFRLNIEQRARQVGLLSAVGFAPRELRRLALGEGMMLAVAGGLIGLAGAVGYTGLMVTGLRTWWVDAVGTTALRLYVEPRTLVIGLLASLAVAFLAILWAVWQIGKTEAARLLAGGRYAPVAAAAQRRGVGIASWVGVAAGLCGLVLLGLGILGTVDPKVAFLAGGVLLLVSCLGLVSAQMQNVQGRRGARGLRRVLQSLDLLCTGVFLAGLGLVSFAAGAYWIRPGVIHPLFLQWMEWMAPLPDWMATVAFAVVITLAIGAWVAATAALLKGGFGMLVPVFRTGSAGVAVELSSIAAAGVRNAVRHTARSVLSIGLIAFAAFTLVTVSAMREGPPTDTHKKESGAGGYTLILQADIPLMGDLGTVQGRKLLGVDPADAPLWDRVHFMPLRSWAGQDISCLNLTRPSTPTILSVPHALVERGGFAKAGENPLALLERPIENDEVPVVTDAETAEYILHLGVGRTMPDPIIDQHGRPRKLKLVGTLSHSIFQSEMLMSEASFLQLFPAQGGFGTVLIEAAPGDQDEVRRLLGSNLGDYAVTVDRTADRLAAYARVKNTYLSTFQTLGSLGLMLGTIGLAVVLLRNLVERRAELALLTALGFRRSARLRLVLSENAFLLVLGLVVGCGCALLGVLPSITSSGRTINFAALSLTLAAVLVIGLGALTMAVWFGQRHISAADLRAE